MHEHHNGGGGVLTSSVSAWAAFRRAVFVRDEVESGRIPEQHPLAQAYMAEAINLIIWFPWGYRDWWWRWPTMTEEERNAAPKTAASREITRRAAHRRADFLRSEITFGRIPEQHPLADAYIDQARRLDEMAPPHEEGNVVPFPYERRWRRRAYESQEDR